MSGKEKPPFKQEETLSRTRFVLAHPSVDSRMSNGGGGGGRGGEQTEKRKGHLSELLYTYYLRVYIYIYINYLE